MGVSQKKSLTVKKLDVPPPGSSLPRSKILKATDPRGIETNARVMVVSPRQIDGKQQ